MSGTGSPFLKRGRDRKGKGVKLGSHILGMKWCGGCSDLQEYHMKDMDYKRRG